MEVFNSNYQEALNYIYQDDYEIATQILKSIKSELPNHPQVIWTLGLMYALTGHPHDALKEWGSILEEDVSSLTSFRMKVENQLPFYESMFSTYNSGLTLIHDKEFESALALFEELLKNEENLPLPVDFYQTYLLLLCILQGNKLALLKVSTFPKHIKKHSVIIKAVAQIERNKKNINQTLRKRLLIGIGIVASLTIGAGITHLSNQLINKVPLTQEFITTNTVQVEEGSIDNENLQKLEGTINDLTNNNKKLQIDLSQAEALLEEKNEVEKILLAADIQLNELEKTAGKSTYQKGINSFQNGDYQEAISFFEQSFSFNSIDYYADDAYYYFIQSNKLLNNSEKLMEYYNQFLSNEGDYFSSSPYYDDILIQKAELLISSSKEVEAIQILEKIQSDYPKEWTSLRSASLLKELKEANDESSS